MKQYKAIDLFYEDGRDYARQLQSYFDCGWEFVSSEEIGNAYGGKDTVVILASDM